MRNNPLRLSFFDQLLPVLIEKMLPLVANFSLEGTDFADVNRLMGSPLARRLIALFVKENFGDTVPPLEAVVSVQSSGYLLGSLVAETLELRHVQIRKDGILPPPACSVSKPKQSSISKMMDKADSDTAKVSVPLCDVAPSTRVLLVDDLISSGNTLRVVAALLGEQVGADVHAFFCLVDLFENRCVADIDLPSIVSIIRRAGK
eukprot:TRINITY_DN57001_c0_g1_i1.p1 TRINITY_DN57001_c0_g1~~TRINITY_DN57001_c0_g1_i1.p1  ORF type:complete len:204 (+),score=36.91 TRINITY_DN57001_c0_g1_i1:182-793(+)